MLDHSIHQHQMALATTAQQAVKPMSTQTQDNDIISSSTNTQQNVINKYRFCYTRHCWMGITCSAMFIRLGL